MQIQQQQLQIQQQQIQQQQQQIQVQQQQIQTQQQQNLSAHEQKLLQTQTNYTERDQIDRLLSILPPSFTSIFSNKTESATLLPSLIEIVMDVGRVPYFFYTCGSSLKQKCMDIKIYKSLPGTLASMDDDVVVNVHGSSVHFDYNCYGAGDTLGPAVVNDDHINHVLARMNHFLPPITLLVS